MPRFSDAYAPRLVPPLRVVEKPLTRTGAGRPYTTLFRSGRTVIENINQLLHVIGQRRGHLQRLPGIGVVKHQLAGVQRLAREFLPGLALGVAQPRRRAALAVYPVADDGVANMRHVHTNLVGAPGFQLDVQQAGARKLAGHAVMGARRAAVGPYDLAAPVHRMESQSSEEHT